jgi:hypothetical protein
MGKGARSDLLTRHRIRGRSGEPLRHPAANARPAAYTTNMATPAANIATVAMATTVHPMGELG